MKNQAQKLCAVFIGFSTALALPACGSADFGGKTPSRVGIQQAGKTTPDTSTDIGAKPGPDGPNGPDSPVHGPGIPNLPGKPPISNDDHATIDKCLKVWKNHPFANPYANVRKIKAAVNVLGFGKSIKDTQATPGPELVIISAAVSVGGQTTMELRNPNGWYCLKVDVNVLNNTTINLDCRAKMADTRVDVGVMSNADATGIVGVHVLSDVKVNRVGC